MDARTVQRVVMSALDQIVVFRLTKQRYALPLSLVERIVRAVEVTPLPESPAHVLGVVDVQGTVIPVVSLRERLGIEPKRLSPGDFFIIAQAFRRTVALVVDAVEGVAEHTGEEIVEAGDILPSLESVGGLVKREDGMILVNSFEEPLCLEE
ncbi:MAG: chemotaxis protein CheW [Candidatus Krumholzibacteriia bacterium]